MQKQIALVFTGDEFADGGNFIQQTLKKENVKASFFFTGNFYRNPAFKNTIQQLKKDNHYLGAHSDQHLLYCDWTKRDSLLVTEKQFKKDLQDNYKAMKTFGIQKEEAHFFLPSYEWYNDTIAHWTNETGLQLVNFTPGTLSNADYTTPDLKNYRSSETIYNSIVSFEQRNNSGLNGFILLVHIGTAKGRTDKFYYRLPALISF
jgi:endoglucanase